MRSMSESPTILVEVTFLLPEEGGRSRPPSLLSGYGPHLVVQIPDVRQAAVVGNVLTEAYLGVYFMPQPGETIAGQPLWCILALVYHPGVDYSTLQNGATFTIREGPHVVGFGTVLEGLDNVGTFR